MRAADRDDRLIRAARHFIEGGSLRDTAAAFRLTPSHLSRSLRQNLPRVAPELAPEVDRRLADARARIPSTAANVRWSRSRQPWVNQLQEETRYFIACVLKGDDTGAHRSAARIREIIDEKEVRTDG